MMDLRRLAKLRRRHWRPEVEFAKHFRRAEARRGMKAAPVALRLASVVAASAGEVHTSAAASSPREACAGDEESPEHQIVRTSPIPAGLSATQAFVATENRVLQAAAASAWDSVRTCASP